MHRYNHGDNTDDFYISVVRVAVLTKYTIIYAGNWLKHPLSMRIHSLHLLLVIYLPNSCIRQQ
jgi:hypothetical protein